MDSPTSRSLAWLREHGFTVQKVEYWDHYAKKRRDLFGVIDIVAINEQGITLGVQATSDTNRSHRREKACHESRLRTWLSGCEHRIFEIHTWGKHGARGARKLWALHRETVKINDLDT